MARKTEKGGKFRNVHCRPWNMGSLLKIMDNEKHPLDDLKKTKSLKNVKNEKCTLQDLEYSKKTENVDHEKYTPQDVKYGEEN